VSEVAGNAVVVRAHSPWSEAWGVFRQNKAAVFGLGLLVLLALAVIVGPFVYAVDPF
jgi:ABC-type antimicrobial peptide transport system permease subunit